MKKVIFKVWNWMIHLIYPNMHPSAHILVNNVIRNRRNLIMGENATLNSQCVIMNDRARVIIKKNAGSARQFLAITGNHMSIVGLNVKQVTNKVKDDNDANKEYDKDIIVEEDVWIGARVSVLSGVTLGRGSEIGTGAVVRTSIPPYSVVVGNPAKIVGFRFTPDEILEHEKALYPENERIPQERLEKNYEKYYLSKINEIRAYLRLSC